MYFFNMLFSKTQLFLYFFLRIAPFDTYLYVLQHVSLLRCYCINTSLYFFLGFSQTQ